MATIYNIDGTAEEITFKNAWTHPADFKKLQELVGGYVERVVRGDDVFAVNEDGRVHGLAQNKQYPEFVGVVVKTTKKGK